MIFTFKISCDQIFGFWISFTVQFSVLRNLFGLNRHFNWQKVRRLFPIFVILMFVSAVLIAVNHEHRHCARPQDATAQLMFFIWIMSGVHRTGCRAAAVCTLNSPCTSLRFLSALHPIQWSAAHWANLFFNIEKCYLSTCISTEYQWISELTGEIGHDFH